MMTKEIDRQQWRVFFDQFSRRHEGWLATVEVFGPEVGDQIEVRERTLRGITADVTRTSSAISVILGATENDRLTHIVLSPFCVRVQANGEGTRESVEIRAADGATTILQFHMAPLLEHLDGDPRSREERGDFS
jgi:uncharacterized protein DUF5335